MPSITNTSKAPIAFEFNLNKGKTDENDKPLPVEIKSFAFGSSLDLGLSEEKDSKVIEPTLSVTKTELDLLKTAPLFNSMVESNTLVIK